MDKANRSSRLRPRFLPSSFTLFSNVNCSLIHLQSPSRVFQLPSIRDALQSYSKPRLLRRCNGDIHQLQRGRRHYAQWRRSPAPWASTGGRVPIFSIADARSILRRDAIQGRTNAHPTGPNCKSTKGLHCRLSTISIPPSVNCRQSSRSNG